MDPFSIIIYTWILKGGVDFSSIKQTISVYPYYRKQTIRQTRFNISANKNIIKSDDMYSIMLGLNYLTGSGTPKDDRLYATPEEGHTAPQNSDTYLNHEYEYLTSAQIGANITVKYSHLFTKPAIKGYVSLNYNYTKAFDVKYIESDTFNRFNLTVGCNF